MEQCAAVENAERILIEACARGETGALGEVVRMYGGALLGYLHKMCGSREQAEDLFQETFKKLFENAHTIRSETLKAWLFTVATRLAINYLRRKRRLRFVSFSNSEDCVESNSIKTDTTDDPADKAMKDERKQQVRQAVLKLPEKMRATLVMAYYQGMSYAEIADCLGCSVGTVKTQMFRAMKTLAEKLPESDG